MTPTDILGWFATAVVIFSFTVKDMFMLRIVNGAGTFLWLVYGILRHDYPVLVVNALIIVAHIIWFCTRNSKKKPKKKQKKDPTDIYFEEIGWMRE